MTIYVTFEDISIAESLKALSKGYAPPIPIVQEFQWFMDAETRETWLEPDIFTLKMGHGGSAVPLELNPIEQTEFFEEMNERIEQDLRDEELYGSLWSGTY